MTEQWRPANATEQAMLEVMTRGSKRDYFRLLIAAELYVPVVQPADDPDDLQFVTVGMLGQGFLLAFTSYDGMAQALPDLPARPIITHYAELRSKWPTPDLQLAVNVGTPLDCYVSIAAIEGLANGTVEIQTAAEAVAAAVTADKNGMADAHVGILEDALRAAIERADPAEYVNTLFSAVVMVPTTRGAGEDHDTPASEFPWRWGGTKLEPLLDVFTSIEAFERAVPAPAPGVTVWFQDLLAAWPDERAGLAVNPGTSLSLTLRADDVQKLRRLLPEPEAEPSGAPT